MTALTPAAGSARPRLTTGDDITCFFTNPGDAHRLTFRAVSLPEGERVAYQIRDYAGKPTGQSGASVVKGRSLSVTEIFPAGYYEVRFPKLELTFGVASLPPFAGEVDPFYAIEGLISSRPRKRQLVDLMLRGGIRSNREWRHFHRLAAVRGEVKTTHDAFYTMAGASGLKSIFCFADFPDWCYDGVKKVGRRPPPRRLLGLDTCIAVLLARCEKGLMAFHILNEYDCYDIPGEAYLPTIKTAGYAMAGNDLPLVGAPFCRGGASASVRSSIDNGLLDYIDIFAFHSYSDPQAMVRQVRAYREAMAGHRKAAMPMWLTESGKPWSRGLAPEQITAVYGGPLGRLHPDPDEDMLSAMWITARAVEAKAAGVAKHFAFTLPFFQERNKNFGMMDYHGTPLRSLTAYMASVRELAGKQYLGDWKDRPANVRALRVFGDERGNLTGVVYTGKTEECTVDLTRLPRRRVRSIDGRDLTVGPNGRIRFPGGLAYVALDAQAVGVRTLDTETKAMALLRQARAYKPVPRVRSPIVYQFDHWRCQRRGRQVYHDESNRFSVNVFNLGSEPVAVAPRLTLPMGMTVAQGPPREGLTVDARSETKLTWTLDRSRCSVARYDIRLTDPKHPHSGVSVPLLNPSGLRAERFDFMNARRWRRNSSGQSTITFDEAEKAVKVSTVFGFDRGKTASGGTNYWVFPEYVLNLPDESLVGAVALSLELKLRQANGSTQVASPLVMFAYQDVHEKGKYDAVRYGEPTGEWRKFTIDINPSKTRLYRMIRVGMCPTAPRIDYWMRDITVYYGR